MACMGIFGRVMTASDKWTRAFMSGEILDVCNILMVLKGHTCTEEERGSLYILSLQTKSDFFSADVLFLKKSWRV